MAVTKEQSELLPKGSSSLASQEVLTKAKVQFLFCSLQFITMALLVAEHTGMPFLVRATNKGKAFLPTTCVFIMEIIKLTLCLTVLYCSNDSFTSFAHKIHNYLWVNKVESLKVTIPAFAYAIQNNLYYIALGNIDATTYTITYQLRILTTAILSVVMLKKKLSAYQWVALTMSGIGVVLVQTDVVENKTDVTAGNIWIGVFATIGMTWTSAFAGVYFEKMLKHPNSNMFVQNMRLSIMTLVFATSTMCSNDGAKIMENGIFQGWTELVWTMTIAAALGGIVVAAVMKYADNVRKTYCQTLAIGLTAVISILIGERQLSLNLVVGVTTVMVSLTIYAFYPPTRRSFTNLSPKPNVLENGRII